MGVISVDHIICYLVWGQISSLWWLFKVDFAVKVPTQFVPTLRVIGTCNFYYTLIKNVSQQFPTALFLYVVHVPFCIRSPALHCGGFSCGHNTDGCFTSYPPYSACEKNHASVETGYSDNILPILFVCHIEKVKRNFQFSLTLLCLKLNCTCHLDKIFNSLWHLKQNNVVHLIRVFQNSL